MSSNRPQPTVADYMAIALSPALIIVLVGSLAFFLLTVFYAGAFEGQMYWVTACFVFAAVLISRISIVEGAERASLFGGVLGLVAALAMMRFTQHPLGAWLVLGLIWWAASHLVWNCTLVDDEDDASGEGLLEAAGLDVPFDAPQADDASTARTGEESAKAAERKQKGTPAAKDAASRGKTGAAADRARRKAAAGAAAEATPAEPKSFVSQFFAWWQQSRSRKAPPGLTVIYFSLAALPMFALGQAFVPTASRKYAFQLVVRYAAAALGLLLTTSFLGLRRYLRQRRLEMPAEMAGTWLTVGAAMAGAIVLAAILIPRPNAEYAISSLTGLLSSPPRQASTYAPLGSDGAEGNSASSAQQNEATRDANSQADAEAAQHDTQGGPAGEGENRVGGSDVGQTDGSQPPQGAGSAGEQTSGGQGGSQSGGQSGGGQKRTEQRGDSSRGEQRDSQQSDAQGGQQPRSSPASGEQSEAAQGSTEQNNTEQNNSAQNNTAQNNATQDNSAERDAGQGENQNNGQQGDAPSAEAQQNASQSSGGSSSPRGGSHSSAPTSSPQQQRSQREPWFNPPQLPQSAGGWLLWLLKMALYLVAIVGGIYCLLRYWGPITAFLARAWQELLALWRAMFGRDKNLGIQAEAEEVPVVRARPFSAFANPFLSGAVRKQPANRIVQYSFEALEAWGSERGLQRHDDETPLEYAARVAAEHPALGDSVQVLGSLYARVAYARETLEADVLPSVEQLWGEMSAGEMQKAK